MQEVIKVTSVIIGTIIGAGFISGQEIYSFFNKYKDAGRIGILISISILAIVIYKTYKIAYENKIKNYEELLDYTMKGTNRIIIYSIKNVINIFLIISFLIMCSAFSTYCQETYGMPRIVGGAIISTLSYIILIKDVRAIINTNELLMPLIIIFIIIISIISIKSIDISTNNIQNVEKTILSGILYANYNSIVLVPMLIGIKGQIKTKKQINQIALFSFIIMLILTFLIYEMQKNVNENLEMPMLSIASQISWQFLIIYGIMMQIAIFTSAISAGYSLICNITKENKYKKIVALTLCIIAIPISTISFSALVNLMYPIFGLLGILQIFFLLKS